jgi:hypothetical protein
MKKIKKNAYSFLAIGKTQDSSEGGNVFKRYVGYGASYVKLFNPTKEQLDEFMGYESSFEPEYVKEEDGEKVVNLHFIVETNPNQCDGIDIKNKAMFTLKLKPALSSSGETVQVLDDYGNYARMNYEDAKAHKPLPGNYKIDQTGYRIACEGEVDLTVFLKKFLNVPSSLDYKNGVWTVKKDAKDNAMCKLENLKDYFKGDFSEIRKALDMQPNNVIKLLYGVKTKDDGKQQQSVCTSADLILKNTASSDDVAKAAKDLEGAKRAGKYSNIDYRVQELQEYDVQPTNLEKPASTTKGSEDSAGEMPWD